MPQVCSHTEIKRPASSSLLPSVAFTMCFVSSSSVYVSVRGLGSACVSEGHRQEMCVCFCFERSHYIMQLEPIYGQKGGAKAKAGFYWIGFTCVCGLIADCTPEHVQSTQRRHLHTGPIL